MKLFTEGGSIGDITLELLRDADGHIVLAARVSQFDEQVQMITLVIWILGGRWLDQYFQL